MEALDFSVVTAGLDTLKTVFTSVWTLITTNPYTVLVMGGSVIGMGVGLFRKLKKGVR